MYLIGIIASMIFSALNMFYVINMIEINNMVTAYDDAVYYLNFLLCVINCIFMLDVTYLTQWKDFYMPYIIFSLSVELISLMIHYLREKFFFMLIAILYYIANIVYLQHVLLIDKEFEDV